MIEVAWSSYLPILQCNFFFHLQSGVSFSPVLLPLIKWHFPFFRSPYPALLTQKLTPDPEPVIFSSSRKSLKFPRDTNGHSRLPRPRQGPFPSAATHRAACKFYQKVRLFHPAHGLISPGFSSRLVARRRCFDILALSPLSPDRKALS